LGALRSCGHSLNVQPWIKIYCLIEKHQFSPCSSAHMTQNPCCLHVLHCEVSTVSISRSSSFASIFVLGSALRNLSMVDVSAFVAIMLRYLSQVISFNFPSSVAMFKFSLNEMSNVSSSLSLTISFGKDCKLLKQIPKTRNFFKFCMSLEILAILFKLSPAGLSAPNAYKGGYIVKLFPNCKYSKLVRAKTLSGIADRF
jgi:hypothetical protein